MKNFILDTMGTKITLNAVDRDDSPGRFPIETGFSENVTLCRIMLTWQGKE